MTLYDKFEELIAIHGMDILDYSDWCKAAFRKGGHTEKDLNTKLFFMLLDKNIPLQIRIITHGKNLLTDYAIAVAVYSKVFDEVYVPNKYEKILLTHTEAIIHILKNHGIIHYEYYDINEKNFITELEPAVVKMVKDFSTDILTHYAFVEAYLKDISGNEISDFDIKSFIVFITALNSDNVSLSLSNDRNLYFMKLMEKVLQKTNCKYEPFYKRSKWN